MIVSLLLNSMFKGYLSLMKPLQNFKQIKPLIAAFHGKCPFQSDLDCVGYQSSGHILHQ